MTSLKGIMDKDSINRFTTQIIINSSKRWNKEYPSFWKRFVAVFIKFKSPEDFYAEETIKFIKGMRKKNEN